MSFADLELLRQGVRLEPLLQAICDFLDKQPVLIEQVRRDLMRGLKAPDKGRHGLTAPQVLRALVLMRVKNWDYRELRERIADGIALRAFTDFYCEEVPKKPSSSRRSAQPHMWSGPRQKWREKRSQIHPHGSTVMPMKST